MHSLRSFVRFIKSDPFPRPIEVAIEGRPVTIVLKRYLRARRMTLRMARDGQGAVMTLPRTASRAEAQAFAEKSMPWLKAQLARQQSPVIVADGAQILLRGEQHVLALTGKPRGIVLHEVAARKLHIPGSPSHVTRRLKDWLRQEAARDLQAASAKYAAAMNVRFTAIAVRDQKSRWGSCTTDGKLSYSWRLVLAPPYVLDYVAAHEVAHLKEMNHGPRFWRLVLMQCPDTKRAKDWLKKHGKDLHRLA